MNTTTTEHPATPRPLLRDTSNQSGGFRISHSFAATTANPSMEIIALENTELEGERTQSATASPATNMSTPAWTPRPIIRLVPIHSRHPYMTAMPPTTWPMWPHPDP